MVPVAITRAVPAPPQPIQNVQSLPSSPIPSPSITKKATTPDKQTEQSGRERKDTEGPFVPFSQMMNTTLPQIFAAAKENTEGTSGGLPSNLFGSQMNLLDSKLTSSQISANPSQLVDVFSQMMGSLSQEKTQELVSGLMQTPMVQQMLQQLLSTFTSVAQQNLEASQLALSQINAPRVLGETLCSTC